MLVISSICVKKATALNIIDLYSNSDDNSVKELLAELTSSTVLAESL